MGRVLESTWVEREICRKEKSPKLMPAAQRIKSIVSARKQFCRGKEVRCSLKELDGGHSHDGVKMSGQIRQTFIEP